MYFASPSVLYKKSLYYETDPYVTNSTDTDITEVTSELSQWSFNKHLMSG